jgi:hypothetical protein
MRASLVVVAAIAFSSCNFPAVVPEALNTEFKATGEVLLYNRTASFDAYRVRSPKCNLSKRTDGSWGGVLAERPVDVSVTDTRISGVELMLTREKSEGNRVVITGQFQGRIYRFELDENRVILRAPNNAYTLDGRQVGPQQTTYGPRGDLQLRGEAGSDNPPWPQIGFALMAMMN